MKATTIPISIDRRRERSLKDLGREQAQPYIDKLQEIYQKLSYCQHYPKRSTRLLNAAAKTIESYLVSEGLPKDRIEEIFKNSLNP